MKIDIIFDMETADPDDVMTLCLVANHSKVNLRAVTVTPGTDEQIGLVKHVLKITNLDIPVGSYHPGYDKKCVPPFYHRWFKNIVPQSPDAEGHQVISETLKNYPNAILLTGAPLKNLTAISETIQLNKWVAQGGFAGDNIVPKKYRLEKFDGRITCPTFNFNGAPTVAESMLVTTGIKERLLVSKNVCHGIVYDLEMHEQFAPYKNKTAGLNLMYQGMSLYLKRKPSGKKYHDPLALAVAINQNVCEFVPVAMFRKKGEWGARPQSNSNTAIAINANVDLLVKTLTDQ